MRICLNYLHLLLILSLFLPALSGADSGKELFDKQCSGCHTVGGGDSGGPDLKGVTERRGEEWLESIIIEPDKMEKDPARLDLVKKYGYEMPNLGIGHDDALEIIAWLKGSSGAGAAAGSQPAAGAAETAVTPELVARGKALFTGASPFAKGGAPCTACHAFHAPGIAGGTMASDLTDLYEGMGEQGLRGVLKSLKFPVMKKIYADRPLTEDEVTALVVFAKDASAREKSRTSALLPVAGSGVLVCCLVVLIIYKRRTR